MKRILYLIYYLKETEIGKLKRFLKVARTRTGRSSIALVYEAVSDSLKYNISILDYFFFRFFEKSQQEKATYAGTGFMYEYQLVMNPSPVREVLENKVLFLNRYKRFIKRTFATYQDLENSAGLFAKLINNGSGKIVVKGSRGQIGAEVKVLPCAAFKNAKELMGYMSDHNFDLVEEFVVQHEALMRLSPSGLNTVRIISQIHDGEVIIIAGRLRITINSEVDNMAAGNVAAPLDIDTGVVIGAGIYSDISKSPETTHPVTGMVIEGFQVPYWAEVIAMVKEAALVEPGNRSVGWDVAIDNNGPQLIEGNHNWCKLLWQLPVKQGLKNQLLTFR